MSKMTSTKPKTTIETVPLMNPVTRDYNSWLSIDSIPQFVAQLNATWKTISFWTGKVTVEIQGYPANIRGSYLNDHLELYPQQFTCSDFRPGAIFVTTRFGGSYNYSMFLWNIPGYQEDAMFYNILMKRLYRHMPSFEHDDYGTFLRGKDIPHRDIIERDFLEKSACSLGWKDQLWM